MARKGINLTGTENRLAVVREYAHLWQNFFSFFADNLHDKNFTREEEEEFAQIVSLLALNQYKLQELSAGYFKGADRVLSILSDCVSLEHLKRMPPATFGKLQIEWHTQFLAMHKALGKMIADLPPKKLAELEAAQQQAHAASA